MNFWVGMFVGIVISAVGFSGLAAVADRGVDQIKNSAENLLKEDLKHGKQD